MIDFVFARTDGVNSNALDYPETREEAEERALIRDTSCVASIPVCA